MPGSGKLEPVGEPAADRDRRLGLRCPVELVVEAQAVPVNGGLEVAVVHHVNDDLEFPAARAEPGPGTEPL